MFNQKELTIIKEALLFFALQHELEDLAPDEWQALEGVFITLDGVLNHDD